MERQLDERMDLRGTPCPLNWVKTKLRLEEMEPGQLLEVLLDDGEAIRNVPRSAKAEGHQIVEIKPFEDGFRVVIARGDTGSGSRLRKETEKDG